MAKAKLTVKQQRFIEEYCANGYNASEAARRAGYSEDTCAEIAYENLRKPQIRSAIDERLKALSLTAEETLKGISDIANSSLNPYFKVKQVYHTPQVKKHLSEVIADIQAQIEDADKFITRAKISDPKELIKHTEQQEHRRMQIIRHEIELERNPEAFMLVAGTPELVEVTELDLPKLVKDKEAGKIKSVKHSEHGLNVELYAADAALTNLARIHGLFEKDNKQQQAKVTLKIGGKSVGD